MSTVINIKLNKKPCYDVVIEKGFSRLKGYVEALQYTNNKCCIVTDSTVGPLYTEKVTKILSQCFTDVKVFTFAAGEESKNLDTVCQLLTMLTENDFTRKDVLFALGGGVVGDLTGFAASIYMRGIDFIQLPTTLLAAVDSSVGGKTGVDYDKFKNLVGAFKMPKLVYLSTNSLSTLTARQYYSGMAEVLKYGLIMDAPFYSWILEHMYEIFDLEPACLEEMIGHCVSCKAKVVEQDPYEEGLRKILNYGHTLGHAIEKHMDFKLYHGECVALGIVCASYISWKKEMLSMEEYYEIRDMMVPFNLPISIDNINLKEVVSLTKKDKKNAEGKVRFVLLKKVGKATWDNEITDEEMLDALNQIYFSEEDMKE